MRTIQLNITTAEIYTCVFAPDGTRALIGSQGNPVTLWELNSGSLVRSYEHNGPVWAIAWSSDQRFFLSVDDRLRLFDVEGVCVREFDERVARCVAWKEDQKQALAASNDTLLLIDLQSGLTLHKLKGHKDGIYCAAFDETGQRALSGSREGTVRVWNLERGSCTGVMEGHSYHVQDVAWAKDQKHMVSCSRDIRLWNVQTGSCVRVLDGHADTIRSVRWSADDSQLVSAAHDGTVRIWDPQTGDCLRVLKGHPFGVVAAVFSHDQRSVFSCDWKGGVRVWDLTKEKQKATA